MLYGTIRFNLVTSQVTQKTSIPIYTDSLMKKLSKNELIALRTLQEAGGSIIEWMVPETTEKNLAFGDITPGHGVYRKLEKMGLAFYTGEEPLNSPGNPMDGFTFSSEIYISDAGIEALQQALNTQV